MIKRIIKCVISKLGYIIPLKSRMTVEEAQEILMDYSPNPNGSCYKEKNVDLKYDLQIIIPTYNVEKYIYKCLESVFNQTSKYNVLITIINDGSTDNTDSIIKKYISNLSQKKANFFEIEYLMQDNKGFSSARNVAFEKIRANYITFLDSDDVLESGAINKMLDVGYSENADIVQGSYYSFGVERKNTILKEGNTISGYPWGKIYKWSVLENFKFPEGYWFEDTPISFILTGFPIKIISISDIVYGYRINPCGITSKSITQKKSIDSYWITERCLQDFPLFGLKYDQRAYEYLLKQIMMNAGRIYKQPREVREAIFIMHCDLIDTYFQGFTSNEKTIEKIEKTLRKRNFIQFEFFRLNI